METSEPEQIERRDHAGHSGPHATGSERAEETTAPDRSTASTDLAAALMERAQNMTALPGPSGVARSTKYPDIDFLATVAKAQRHLAARRAALPRRIGSD
jgi:hypothetical protein